MERKNNHELSEVNKQIAKYKRHFIGDILGIIFGVYLTLTIVFSIIGIPFIIFALIFLIIHKNKLNNLKIIKARAEDKK